MMLPCRIRYAARLVFGRPSRLQHPKLSLCMSTSKIEPIVKPIAIELVYFDIHARGELTRLCYATHEAAGGEQAYVDTRLPLFMESEANRRLIAEVHRPASPFSFFPYLKVTCDDDIVTTLSGGCVIETFVARRLGLMGKTELEAAVCATVAENAVVLGMPALTRAGLFRDHPWIVHHVQPSTPLIGCALSYLERYVAERSKDSPSSYIVGDSLTVADLSIFNVVDECVLGPRSNEVQVGVEDQMRKHYPRLMETYDLVTTELADYIIKRQARFLHVVH